MRCRETIRIMYRSTVRQEIRTVRAKILFGCDATMYGPTARKNIDSLKDEAVLGYDATTYVRQKSHIVKDKAVLRRGAKKGLNFLCCK
jgi:hypothetical protein